MQLKDYKYTALEVKLMHALQRVLKTLDVVLKARYLYRKKGKG